MAAKSTHRVILFLGNAESVYIAGSILCPDSSEVARALKLAQKGAPRYLFSSRSKILPALFPRRGAVGGLH